MRAFLLAASTPANPISYLIGGAAVVVLLIVYVFAVIAIVKAFSRRTTGWIAAGSLGGVIILLSWLAVIAGVVTGVRNSWFSQTSSPGKTPFGGVYSSRTPQTVRGQTVPYQIVLPPEWTRLTQSADFDLIAHRNNLYCGVIAEEGSIGTPEAIAEVARKRLLSQAADAQFSDFRSEQIDGHTWLQAVARCHIGGVPISYQFHVYSGDEGTFQVVGWTAQNLYDRDADKMHAIANTFRFPATSLAKVSPAGTNAATASPTPTPALQALQGHDFAYHLSMPADWKEKKSEAGFDLLAYRASLYVGVTVEEGSLGTTEAALKASQDNLRKLTTELHLSDPVPVKIDGHDWLEFTAQCLLDKLPITYQYHVHAGPEGTYRIIGWTTQNLYARDAETLRNVATTFRFPPAGEPTVEDAATAGPPRVVHGKELDYQLTLPAVWQSHEAKGVFDMEAAHHSAFLGVVAEEAPMGTSKAAAAFVQANLRSKSTNLKFGETASVKIDGRDWLHFTATCQINHVPLSYQYFVYAGPEGTYRIVCWSLQNVYERHAEEMRVAAMSFRFPAKTAQRESTPAAQKPASENRVKSVTKPKSAP